MLLVVLRVFHAEAGSQPASNIREQGRMKSWFASDYTHTRHSDRMRRARYMIWWRQIVWNRYIASKQAPKHKIQRQHGPTKIMFSTLLRVYEMLRAKQGHPPGRCWVVDNVTWVAFDVASITWETQRNKKIFEGTNPAGLVEKFTWKFVPTPGDLVSALWVESSQCTCAWCCHVSSRHQHRRCLRHYCNSSQKRQVHLMHPFTSSLLQIETANKCYEAHIAVIYYQLHVIMFNNIINLSRNRHQSLKRNEFTER